MIYQSYTIGAFVGYKKHPSEVQKRQQPVWLTASSDNPLFSKRLLFYFITIRLISDQGLNTFVLSSLSIKTSAFPFLNILFQTPHLLYPPYVPGLIAQDTHFYLKDKLILLETAWKIN